MCCLYWGSKRKLLDEWKKNKTDLIVNISFTTAYFCIEVKVANAGLDFVPLFDSLLLSGRLDVSPSSFWYLLKISNSKIRGPYTEI